MTAMTAFPRRPAVAGACALLALLLAACGSGGGGSAGGTSGGTASGGASSGGSASGGTSSGGTTSGGTSSGGTSGGAPASVPSEVRATSLQQFQQQQQGQPGWQGEEQNWAANAVVDLNNDGTFTFNTSSAIGIPLQGQYTVSGSQVSFSGSDTTQLAAGSSSLSIQGTIDLNQHTMQFSWSSTTGAAANVDGQGFAQATGSQWSAVDQVSF